MPRLERTDQQARRASRRESARERTRRRARQRRLLQLGAVALVVVVALALVAAWWLRDRSTTSGSQALFRFDTQDVHSLVFDLTDADTLYFGHHGGLLVSRNGGAQWEPGSLTSVDAMQQALALGDGSRHYVAGHDVFLVSDDGGRSWREQPNNLPSLDLHTFAGSPSDPDRLYAIPTGLGLWTSRDGGATWTEATLPEGPQTQPIALTVAPDDPETVILARSGQIATSRDGGQTWETAPGPAGIITALALAGDAERTLYAGTNQGLFRRAADGTWEAAGAELQRGVAALAVSPVLPSRIAVVDLAGNVYRSDDGGQSWARGEDV